MKSKNERVQELLQFDNAYNAELVCGVDEAGRGPLAGPVVTACVIMPSMPIFEGIYDSKKVSENERGILFEKIKEHAVAYRVEVIEPKMIDVINILEATKRGMERAILSLKVVPSVILVDAVKGLKIGREYHAVIKGDTKSYAIAAASILAKVTRDKLMEEAAQKYPLYGFSTHKGYGTAAHIAALKMYGKTEIHRESFLKNFSSVIARAEEGDGAHG
ncbi:MAG: ribonuclease HII [Firmicutes bacterium]|nr:ribonuclease HII [Bacillota bacterium]